MLVANLQASSTVASGVLTMSNVAFGGNGAMRSGSATIDVEGVPEPSTLGMLGTGLIGLSGLARRSFKLWR